MNSIEAEISDINGNIEIKNCTWNSETLETKDKRIKELELMLFDSDLHLEAAKEEINRLKSILKDVKLTAEWHIEDCACFHPMSKYQLGWFEAMNLIKEKVDEL